MVRQAPGHTGDVWTLLFPESKTAMVCRFFGVSTRKWADIMSHNRWRSSAGGFLGKVWRRNGMVALQVRRAAVSLGCRRPTGRGLEHVSGEYHDAFRTRAAFCLPQYRVSPRVSVCIIWLPRSGVPFYASLLHWYEMRGRGRLVLIHLYLSFIFPAGWLFATVARKAGLGIRHWGWEKSKRGRRNCLHFSGVHIIPPIQLSFTAYCFMGCRKITP